MPAKKRSRRQKIFLSLLLSAGLIVALLRLWPSPPLRQFNPLSTALYDQNKELMRLTLASDGQFRLWVPLSQVDPRLIEAVQLYEDRWFYWHPGVNPIALTRAFFATYGRGRRQGASTLSMQLARRLYRISSQNLGGKLKQIGAALWLELRCSKKDILEAYLNLAPYGGNIEGIGTASLVYFHKRVEQLTLPELLTLAVIPQNPNRRGPKNASPLPLLEARQRLFETWRTKHPDAAKYQADIRTAPRLFSTRELPFRAPHFSDQLLRLLKTSTDKPQAELLSTIDLRLQNTLERAVSQFIATQRSKGVRNTSAILVDRVNGEIRAMLGSADYFDTEIDGQVNGIDAKRSPGSTLKPFIYGLALDQGLLHPRTVLRDAPTSFGPFSPENFDGRFMGPITAQEALVRSRNIPAVSISAQLKQPNLYEFLKSAGVEHMASEQHYGLALALGGGEVTPEELARLYLILANRGRAMPLRYLAGEAPQNPTTKSAEFFSEEAAFITLRMLESNPRPDTEAPASPAVAWKTGTSWGFRDAWTAGIFGRYVLVLWIGNFDSSGNPTFVGVQTAAPLFFKIVDSIRSQGLDPGEAPKPLPQNLTRLEVCAASGDLPNEWCKDLAWTWFIPGKSPIKVSTLHRAVKIDTRSGLATCEDGPHVKTEIFEFWPSDLQRLFRDAGIPRRMPPPLPDCVDATAILTFGSDGPKITSPKLGLTYLLRLSKPVPLALRANVQGAGGKLFWFADEGLIGQVDGTEGLAWTPAKHGRYQLRVIDTRGRADVREVNVEFVP